MSGNRRNNHKPRQVQTPLGEVTVHTPRESTFEPEFIKKCERILADGVANRIIGLYAMGNSTRQTSDWMEENLGNRVSAKTIRVMDEKNRPITRVIYNILGINKEGYKDLFAKSEGANFWLYYLSIFPLTPAISILSFCLSRK